MNLKKIIAIAAALIMTISVSACQQAEKTTSETPSSQAEVTSSEAVSSEAESKEEASSEAEKDGEVEKVEIGEGETVFDFEVKDEKGNVTYLAAVSTDKETLGEALQELELIEGEDGEYGLYIKTVNGVTVDFDKDGMYWSLVIDGEYATTSADQTTIEEGKVYTLEIAK